MDLDNQQLAFYIDNKNAKMALIKSDSKRRIIAISVRILGLLYHAEELTHGLKGPVRITISGIDLSGSPNSLIGSRMRGFFLSERTFYGWCQKRSLCAITDVSTRLG